MMALPLCLGILFLLDLRYRQIIRQHHRNLVRLLEQATSVLESAGIPYWLDWGTLLGAIRDDCLMAHDTDVDISVPLDRVSELRAIPAWPGLEFTFYGETARLESPRHPWLEDIGESSLLEITFVDPQTPNLWPLGRVGLAGRTYPTPGDPQAYLLARYGFLGRYCVYLGGNRYRPCGSWQDYARFFWNHWFFYRVYFLWKGTPMPRSWRKLAESISGKLYPLLMAAPKT